MQTNDSEIEIEKTAKVYLRTCTYCNKYLGKWRGAAYGDACDNCYIGTRIDKLEGLDKVMLERNFDTNSMLFPDQLNRFQAIKGT